MSSDQITLLRSNSDSSEEDIEGQNQLHTPTKGVTDLIKRLDRRFSPRRKRGDLVKTHSASASSIEPSAADEILGDGAPPEWALLLLGCLLGLATGLCVAGFNRGVSVLVFICFCVAEDNVSLLCVVVHLTVTDCYLGRNGIV